MSQIQQAFEICYHGFSADRVVIDPELNLQFVAECRKIGLEEPVATLNRKLLNLRKRGLLSEYKTVQRTSFPDENDYQFAAEIAARFMERRHETTLDRILCDPDFAAQFDESAAKIMPGYLPLQYRWAALNLRKSRGLKPELASRVAATPQKVIPFAISGLQLEQIPAGQGLYLFYDSKKLLYIGESDNLRLRLKKHLDHSDNKGFARWLWEFGPTGLNVEIHVLDPDTTPRARRALELEMIRSREPEFNIQR